MTFWVLVMYKDTFRGGQVVLHTVKGMIPTGASCTTHDPTHYTRRCWGEKGQVNCCMQTVVEAWKAERAILCSVEEHRYPLGREGSPPQLRYLGFIGGLKSLLSPMHTLLISA